MAKEVRLPQLGQTMEEATFVSCQVNVGDQVSKGDVIFEVETDKATLELESPGDGFVKSILVEVGRTVAVNTPVMVLGAKDEEISQEFIDSLKAEGAPQGQTADAGGTGTASEPVAAVEEPAIEAPKKSGKVLASPRAKKLARKLGVDLAVVAGSGPGGRITETDVKAASERPAAKGEVSQPTYKLGEKVPISRLQRITAEKMLQSKREIPCFYLTARADVTELVALRAKLNRQSEVKISFSALLIRATALALKQYPIMTGQSAGDYIQLAESINIGLAVAVADGLIAVVVRDVGNKDLVQIVQQCEVLIDKANSNKLSLDDLEGGCITISSLGAFGVDSFIPIVVPGQCSILGIGRITDTCVPIEGNLMVRKLMNLTLSVDHRIVNGAYAAQFLDFLRKTLEDSAIFG